MNMDKKTQNIIHRLKIINGQINGVVNSIEKDDECSLIFNQLTSIKSALKSCSLVIAKKYIVDCISKKEKKLDDIIETSVKLLS